MRGPALLGCLRAVRVARLLRQPLTVCVRHPQSSLLVKALEPAKLPPSSASAEQLKADTERAKQYSRLKARLIAHACARPRRRQLGVARPTGHTAPVRALCSRALHARA